MSYPGLLYELGDQRDSKQKEHEEYHVAENIFEEGCNFCVVEKCLDCRGRGMTEQCEICKRCDGRGRIL